jgi:hypothetical protein
MKRENIVAFVHDPSKLDQSSLGELEELLDAYPWFQTAHLLVAKNHHNIDSIKFHEILRDSAAYVGDRTVLYHLIHSPAPKTGITWMDEPEKVEPEIETVDNASQAEVLIRRLPDPEPATDGTDEIMYAEAYQLEKETTPSETSAIEEYTFTGWFDHFQTISPEKPARTEHDELIDKFIKDSPVIARGIDVPPAEKDISGAGLLDSDSFMTETLARIYENQGLLKKAIYAYEKLSLKYPEKSTYFATQINRIKSQLEKN